MKEIKTLEALKQVNGERDYRDSKGLLRKYVKEDYPLYMKWRFIIGYLLDLCGKYPKNVRFNLCDRITNMSLDVLEGIVEAIYAKRKTDILLRANLYMEKLRALMQISVDKKFISLSQYEYICSEINEAGKMIGGWIKSCRE